MANAAMKFLECPGLPDLILIKWVNGAEAQHSFTLTAHSRQKEGVTMLVTRNDFRIDPRNFDLSDGHNVLRIICGLFMFPHIAGKFVAGALNPGTVGFFAKAGFVPPEYWVLLAAFAEGATGIALVLGICTRWSALGAAGVMAFAVYALHMVKGFGWTWNTGGYEYPVFWGLAAVAVALTEFKRMAATEDRRQPAALNTLKHA
jgi:putative oxidoreductase